MDDLEQALVYLSEVQDLVDLSEYMQDEDFSRAMDLALKVIAKPDLPPAVALKIANQLEAYSFRFKMQAVAHMTIFAGKDKHKKNTYYSMSEKCHDLSMTMKHVARPNNYA